MFVIRMHDGEEIHFSGSDRLEVNPTSGILTVHRPERHGDVITHYSPIAWRTVTYRTKRGMTPMTTTAGDDPAVR